MNDHHNNIIFVPYAELTGAVSGANISNKVDRQSVYLQNCCVSLISAKKNNNCDVALVTNIEVPDPYKTLLIDNGVLIMTYDFDRFLFDQNYRWKLAFYKLCALSHIVGETQYDNYAYLDTDVFIQGTFDNVWSECKHNILLYDINDGLQVENYRIFLDEVNKFGCENAFITHYGGEFFAANRENALIFIDKCAGIYNEMVAKCFETTKGDEFITSIAAASLRNVIKNAGAYIYRFWTGSGFRYVSTRYMYNPVVVLHVPDEKNRGLLKIYRKYISQNKMPQNKTVYRIFRFNNVPIIEVVKMRIKKVIKI